MIPSLRLGDKSAVEGDEPVVAIHGFDPEGVFGLLGRRIRVNGFRKIKEGLGILTFARIAAIIPPDKSLPAVKGIELYPCLDGEVGKGESIQVVVRRPQDFLPARETSRKGVGLPGQRDAGRSYIRGQGRVLKRSEVAVMTRNIQYRTFHRVADRLSSRAVFETIIGYGSSG